MITREAIHHIPKSNYSYGYDKDTLHIRLKTKKGEVDKVYLRIGDPYIWESGGANGGNMSAGGRGWQAFNVLMEKEVETEYFDHWIVSYKPKYKRSRYAFILENKDEKILFTEKTIFDLDGGDDDITKLTNQGNFFCFPYINNIDVPKVPEWVNNTVWYQIFPDRFNNGDKSLNEDYFEEWGSIPTRTNFMGGDIKGVTDKLDYLQDLGVSGLYFCPIFKATSNHRYDTIDYMELDPRLGSNEDLKNLVQEAHKRGIKVMLDAVFNHIGFESPLWQDVVKNGEKSKYKDWFCIHRFPVIDKPIEKLNGKELNYETFGTVYTMPKLNTENPEVIEYLVEVGKYWVREFDIDAWRLDVSNEVDHRFWRRFRDEVKSIKEDVYLLGELWHDGLPWLMGDQYDSAMNYPLADAIENFICKDDSDATDFKYAMNAINVAYPVQVTERIFNLVDSHDTPRLLTNCENNIDKAKLAYLLMFTQPGCPCIYYGDEIGMDGEKNEHSELHRKCMEWDEDKQDKEMLDFMKKLIKVRKENEDLRSIKNDWIETNDKIIVLRKGNITVFVNNAEEEVSIKLPQYLINKKVIDLFENKSITLKDEILVEGYGFTMIKDNNVTNYKYLDEFYYDKDLGAIYTKEKTTFIIWAPTANNVNLALYGTKYRDNNEQPKKIIPMKKGESGTWIYEIEGNLHGHFYNYIVFVDGKKNIVTDPYAKSVGVNGHVGMVVDLSRTNPKGWREDTKPKLENATDSIIYEMHIRDFSINQKSGITNKGKYAGVWERNTKVPNSSISTGIEHLKELGVNTVHLLPSYDYISVDERNDYGYNWGYDPQNYNVPEGSYSTNPYDGVTRIKEYKEMVHSLHKEGIRVVMDVVYNHTGLTETSNLNLAVPNYYYRQNENGGFSNSSGCGNETASERLMVRKFIVDSVKYWASEYHVDGFRFDLMAIHDIETMKMIREELDKIDKSIIVYGEGWNGGATPLPEEEAAFKRNTYKYGKLQIAAFSDDIRDGIKGHVFEDKSPGFVNGKSNFEEVIKFGVVASTNHTQVDYSKINYSQRPWANEPYQTVTYASAHDNLTLWDKLQTVSPKATKEELIDINKLASAIVLTSQGISFIHAGEELARTKTNENGKLIENSYNSGDYVNKIDWERKEEYKDLFNYYKGLIKIRKHHSAFRMNNSDDIRQNIKFMQKGIEFKEDNVVGYTINGEAVGDEWSEIGVIFNANTKDITVNLSSNNWVVFANKERAGIEELEIISTNEIIVKSKSAMIIVKITE